MAAAPPRDEPATVLTDRGVVQSGRLFGCWALASNPDVDTASANHWCADTVHGSLRAFAEIARPTRVTIVSSAAWDAPTARDVLAWDERSSVDAFADRAVAAIRAAKLPIWEVGVALDVCASINPAGDDAPRWVRPGGELVVKPQPDEGAYAYVNIANALFCPRSAENEATPARHAHNQPRLERALHRWEAKVGPIDTVDGDGDGLYQYGFWKTPLGFRAVATVAAVDGEAVHERDIRAALGEAVADARTQLGALPEPPVRFGVCVDVTLPSTDAAVTEPALRDWLGDELTALDAWGLVERIDVYAAFGWKPAFRFEVRGTKLVAIDA